jgi:hypothetical protein
VWCLEPSTGLMDDRRAGNPLARLAFHLAIRACSALQGLLAAGPCHWCDLHGGAPLSRARPSVHLRTSLWLLQRVTSTVRSITAREKCEHPSSTPTNTLSFLTSAKLWAGIKHRSLFQPPTIFRPTREPWRTPRSLLTCSLFRLFSSDARVFNHPL